MNNYALSEHIHCSYSFEGVYGLLNHMDTGKQCLTHLDTRSGRVHHASSFHFES